MNSKKKDDDKMKAVVQKQQTDRKSKIHDIFAKAVKANDKALERLSNN
ncbi:MAG: hypothetical protein ABF649_06720 [Bacillus sp. (in: firmicutes)]